MVLVESIPLHMKYKENVTIGIPLEKIWKDLISMATDQVDVVSFYWTLTGEDINVNSSSDIPVSRQLKHKETTIDCLVVFRKKAPNTVSLPSAGERHPDRTWRVALQECVRPSGDQCPQCSDKLHRFKGLKTERFVLVLFVFICNALYQTPSLICSPSA